MVTCDSSQARIQGEWGGGGGCRVRVRGAHPAYFGQNLEFFNVKLVKIWTMGRPPPLFLKIPGSAPGSIPHYGLDISICILQFDTQLWEPPS